MFECNGLAQPDRRPATDGDATVSTEGNGLGPRTLSDIRGYVHHGIGAHTYAALT